MVIVRTLLLSLVFAPVSGAANWSSSADLVKDMVVLDKAYVPALVLSREGDLSRAEIAVKRLVDSWGVFQSKWKPNAGAAWRTGFERINALVGESASQVSSAQDLKRAHTVLDEVRHILSRLRRNEGIAYFGDRLTAFDDALDEVKLAVVQDQHLIMSSDELDVSENLLLEAARRWKAVVETRLDKIVYRIDYYGMGEVASYREEGARLLDELLGEARMDRRCALQVRRSQQIITVTQDHLTPNLRRGSARKTRTHGYELEPFPGETQHRQEFSGLNSITCAILMLKNNLTGQPMASEVNDVPSIRVSQRVVERLTRSSILESSKLDREVARLRQ